MKKTLTCLLITLISVTFVSCNRKEKTSPVRKNIQDAVFASGNVEQDEEYIISSKTTGILQSVTVKEGDTVDTNELIGIIKSDAQEAQFQDAKTVYSDSKRNNSDNSPQLMQIQTQITQAKQQLELDKTNYLRIKELRNKNSVSQLDFDKTELQYKNSQGNVQLLEKKYVEIKNALQLNAQRSLFQIEAQKALLNDYAIRADKKGQVINVSKKEGELVRIGDPIAKIGSGTYIVKLFVSEDDITKIALGQHASVHLNTYPDKTFPAKVTKIFPGFDSNEQSYIVEATFESIPKILFSGTQLQANIETKNRNNVLVIPTSFIIKEKFVTLDNGTQREIVTGSSSNDWTEIISGITEKDIITKKKSKNK
ncbi:MAG: efflux RND transporter periplasmic adaptor subunit [Paludibacteraceae bacterium]